MLKFLTRFSLNNIILAPIFFISFYASANQISVSDSIVEFTKDSEKYIDIKVNNESNNEKAFVKIEVFEIENPGEKDQKRILVNKGSENILIASPQKLVIQPLDKKMVRIVSLHKNLSKDKIYRISITPVVGDVTTDAAKLIKVLVGYDILAIIRPDEIKPEIAVSNDKKKIIFSNGGNTNIFIHYVRQCDRKGENCKNLGGTRLYSGNKFEKELPYDKNDVEYGYSVMDKEYPKKYKPI